MSFVEIKIDGGEKLSAQLKKIQKGLSGEIVFSAIKKALQPTLSQSKQNAISMVGGKMGAWLSQSLYIKPFRRKRRGSSGMNVGIHKSYNSFFVYLTRMGLRHYIPSAIEYGHAKSGKSIEHRAAKLASIDTQIEYGNAKVPAIPFMRKATDNTFPSIPKIFEDELIRKINEVSK